MSESSSAHKFMIKRRGLLARFARSRKGATALEFAMVSVPFLGLLCAIFETAFVFFVHEAFDASVLNAARQVLVNSASGATSASSFVTTYLKPSLPSFIDYTQVVLNINAYPISQPGAYSPAITQAWYNNPSQQNYNLGNPTDVIVFQAFYPMPIYLSVLTATGANGRGIGNLFGQAGGSVVNAPSGSGLVHAIFTTVVFRNEPT